MPQHLTVPASWDQELCSVDNVAVLSGLRLALVLPLSTHIRLVEDTPVDVALSKHDINLSELVIGTRGNVEDFVLVSRQIGLAPGSPKLAPFSVHLLALSLISQPHFRQVVDTPLDVALSKHDIRLSELVIGTRHNVADFVFVLRQVGLAPGEAPFIGVEEGEDDPQSGSIQLHASLQPIPQPVESPCACRLGTPRQLSFLSSPHCQ